MYPFGSGALFIDWRASCGRLPDGVPGMPEWPPRWLPWNGGCCCGRWCIGPPTADPGGGPAPIWGGGVKPRCCYTYKCVGNYICLLIYYMSSTYLEIGAGSRVRTHCALLLLLLLLRRWLLVARLRWSAGWWGARRSAGRWRKALRHCGRCQSARGGATMHGSKEH